MPKKSLFSLLFLLTFVPCFSQQRVVLTEKPDRVILANQHVTATINRKTATITSLLYKGLELMGQRPHPHWNVVGEDEEVTVRKFPNKVIYSVSIDPAKNQGERVEVSFKFLYEGDTATLPFDIDLRFALGQEDRGVYLSALWKRRPGYPAFELGQGRMITVLNPQVFDFYTVDAHRQGVMATAEDVKNGIRMNVKEAKKLTTGVHQGKVEHKYDYAAILAQTPAWGWTSTAKKVGFWMINPSFEYINGGPTQVGNTGHVEAILLNHWHDSHYGGQPLNFKEDEEWEKFIGPFFLYCNAGPTHDEMWKDALAQAGTQRNRWPYTWVKAKAYPQKQERGVVSGQIEIQDPYVADVKFKNMWVGLAVAETSSKEVNWQYEGKAYQFWVQADEQGNFSIPNIRPGTYNLYAFAAGVLGEFKKTGITISPASTVNLGKLAFKPQRFGKQVWEIGIPDRSAAEFRHGDHYWQWGLYMRYPKEFPDDVNYVIGKSDWSKDWNYSQPGVLAEDYSVLRGTTWKISFDMPEHVSGQGTLRLAFCGSRKGEVIQVALNGKPIGKAGPLPTMGVMHRDGIRGKQEEYDIPFDARLLKKGTNTISLSFNPRNWAFGVLYDYVRLELKE
ncbi:polysaccharide lyase family protein [Botryobacter ruber]|uniref:polysaccharide lyase family protein n=1 Tax=Botryobacter ruber TaxID=2171629 RepID=UPI000E0A8B42|nr:polysaccharide lyase family protein [Botryobacter ruber]